MGDSWDSWEHVQHHMHRGGEDEDEDKNEDEDETENENEDGAPRTTVVQARQADICGGLRENDGGGLGLEGGLAERYIVMGRALMGFDHSQHHLAQAQAGGGATRGGGRGGTGGGSGGGSGGEGAGKGARGEVGGSVSQGSSKTRANVREATRCFERVVEMPLKASAQVRKLTHSVLEYSRKILARIQFTC
jgi:hypothetical protein